MTPQRIEQRVRSGKLWREQWRTFCSGMGAKSLDTQLKVHYLLKASYYSVHRDLPASSSCTQGQWVVG